MNLPVWPVLVLLVLAAVREAAREFLSFLLTKIRYTLTRSSPGTRGAPQCQCKGHPFLPHIPMWSVRPFRPRDSLPALGGSAGQKTPRRVWGGPSLGAPMANPVNVCRSSAVLLCVNELWGVQI